MKDDEKILKEIHKNAQVGKGTLERVLSSIGEIDIRDDLKRQLKGYDGFCDKSKQMLENEGEQVNTSDTLQNLSMGIGVKMNLMIDDSSSHVAQMVIEGSNMGIIDLTKALNDSKSIAKPYKELAEGLIQFEQNNIESLKKYL